MKKYLYILIATLLLFIISFLSVKAYRSAHVQLKPISFQQLPSWQNADLSPSFKAFQSSCKVFLKSDPNKVISSELIDLKVKDFVPACLDAKSLPDKTNKELKKFFERWFTPYMLYKHKALSGLFTGYFMPTLNGSLTKTEKYNVPIYGLPDNMITIDWKAFRIKSGNSKLNGRVVKSNKLVPFYSREEINNGAIKDHASVIVWLDNKIDRQFLEIEGSGIVKLDDNKFLYVGYKGENGATYKSLPSIFIEQGIFTKDTATQENIKKYFQTHPEKLDYLLNKNKSFVFFEKLPNNEAIGAQGVGLTPGYSLAIDKNLIPYGLPIWLNTTIPDLKSSKLNDKHTEKPFNRLMVAQDTGGAIRGPVRGDIFLGAGEDAKKIASHTKAKGSYWLLVPHQDSATVSQ